VGIIDEALAMLGPQAQPQAPSLVAKWNVNPRRLFMEGYLAARPKKLSASNTKDFERLVGYRNDITHANLSLPVVLAPSDEASRQWRTTTTTLAQLPPGWAIGVAAERIRQLHRSTGTQVPDWVQLPLPSER
jgi:hypothetical protein